MSRVVRRVLHPEDSGHIIGPFVDDIANISGNICVLPRALLLLGQLLEADELDEGLLRFKPLERTTQAELVRGLLLDLSLGLIHYRTEESTVNLRLVH